MVQGGNFSMIHPLIVHIPEVEDIHEILSPVEGVEVLMVYSYIVLNKELYKLFVSYLVVLLE